MFRTYCDKNEKSGIRRLLSFMTSFSVHIFIVTALLIVPLISMNDLPEIEVYSRVVGYLRPINQWNGGKKQEYGDRKTFKVNR